MKRQMKPVRAGFVPLIDAAPLIMARELGLYEKYGLKVQLSREIGWATIRDKIIFGQLEAAHALAAMPFAASIGYDVAKSLADFHVFHRYEANAPTRMKAVWVSDNLLRLGQTDRSPLTTPAALPKIFREDIFQTALRLIESRSDAEAKSETETETETETACCP